MKLRTVRKLNKKISVVSVVAALSILAIVSLSGFLFAKYTKEIPYSGNVTISAELASGFSLYENKVTQDPKTGAYIVSEEKVTTNNYFVLPGVAIPKNPTIEITGKTNIEAYLYIEVVDEVDHDYINFELTDNWVLVNDATPVIPGAKVYVYSSGGNPVIFDGTPTDHTISIIKDNTLTVKTTPEMDAAISLDFHTCMLQIIDGMTPSQIYNEITPAP